jgi:hypothetical protein
VKSSQGKISRDTAEAESLSDSISLISGPYLGLDARQWNTEDTPEDSSKTKEMA